MSIPFDTSVVVRFQLKLKKNEEMSYLYHMFTSYTRDHFLSTKKFIVINDVVF